jgi:hypothetical protein
MRISSTKVVQFIDSEPPRMVILDESNMQEILFTPEEMDPLMHAVSYFYPYMKGGEQI